MSFAVGANGIKEEPEWEDYCISEAQAREAARARCAIKIEPGPDPPSVFGSTPDTNCKTGNSTHDVLNSIKSSIAENKDESVVVKEEKSCPEETTGLYEGFNDTDKIKLQLDLNTETVKVEVDSKTEEPPTVPPVIQKTMVDSRRNLIVINNAAQEVNRKKALQPPTMQDKPSQPVTIKYTPNLLYTPQHQPVLPVSNSLLNRPDNVIINPEVGLLSQPSLVANALLKNNLVSVKQPHSISGSQAQLYPLLSSVACKNSPTQSPIVSMSRQPQPATKIVRQPLPTGVFRPINAPISQPLPEGIFRQIKVPISQLNGRVSLKPIKETPKYATSPPNLQCGSITKLQSGMKTSLLQNNNMPNLRPGNMPSLQPSNMPKLQPGSVAKLLNNNMPKLRPGNMPNLQPGNMAKLRNNNMPKLRPGNMPNLQPGNMAKLRNNNMPKLQPGNMPILQPGNMAKLQNSDIPTLQPGNMAEFQTSNIPTLQAGNMRKIQPNNILTLKTNIIDLQSGTSNLGSAKVLTLQPATKSSLLLEVAPRLQPVAPPRRPLIKPIVSNRFDYVKSNYQKVPSGNDKSFASVSSNVVQVVQRISIDDVLKSNTTTTVAHKPLVPANFRRIARKPIQKRMNSQISKAESNLPENIISDRLSDVTQSYNILLAPKLLVPRNENSIREEEINQGSCIQRIAAKSDPKFPINSQLSKSGDNDIRKSINDDPQPQNLPPNYAEKPINLEDFLKPSYVLLEHMKERTCKVCQKTFYESRALIDHTRTHAKIPVISIIDLVNDDEHTEYLESDTAKSSERLVLTCKYCQKHYFHHNALYHHIRRDHLCIIKQYHCDYCGKICLDRYNLVNHIRTHTGEKPYKCLICKTQYRTCSNFLSHNAMHDTKKYHCPICDRPFHKATNRAKHIKTHSGVRPHACMICDKRFREKHHLIRHTESHSGERRYLCKTCKKRFTRKSHLDRHQKNIHGKKVKKRVKS